MRALDDGQHVLYIGSFSKMLAPAMRLGWIVAPDELGNRITVLRESLDLESSQITQRAAAEFLTSGYLDGHLAKLNNTNLQRKNVLMASLQQHFAPLGAK